MGCFHSASVAAVLGFAIAFAALPGACFADAQRHESLHGEADRLSAWFGREWQHAAKAVARTSEQTKKAVQDVENRLSAGTDHFRSTLRDEKPRIAIWSRSAIAALERWRTQLDASWTQMNLMAAETLERIAAWMRGHSATNENPGIPV